jgi:hypothetical protein
MLASGVLKFWGEPFCRGDRQFERVHHKPHREQVEPCEALGLQAHGRTPSASLKQREVDQASEWISLAIVAHGHSLDWGNTWYVPLTEAMATLRSYSLTLGRGQWGDVPIRGTVSICTFRIHVDACAHLSLKPFPTIVGT